MSSNKDDSTERDNIPIPLQRPVTRFFSVPAILCLAALIAIPLLEAVGRRTIGVGVVGAAAWTQHLTLWLAFIGAILASLSNRHISISATKILAWKHGIGVTTPVIGAVTATLLGLLAVSSFQLVYYQYGSPESIGGWFPLWLAQLAMPTAFLMMGLVRIGQSSRNWLTRALLTLIATVAAGIPVLFPGSLPQGLVIPVLCMLFLLAFLGMPLYAVLGGTGLILLFGADIPLAALPAETYRIVTQPVLPSIPLFALAGTVLGAGGAPHRMLRVIRAWTSWMPGGVAISAVCACAFFTAVTGASGVTILALGGMLLPIMISAHYRKRFSVGLLTASGSVGLLFPPSLPVILYGVYGNVAINKLFMGALLPGALLVVMLIGFCIFNFRRSTEEREAFHLREALHAAWVAKGDFLLPIAVLYGLFSGIFTLVETAAFVALWSILLETLVHKELQFRQHLVKLFIEAAILAGALLIVLGVAAGLVSYLVDEQIPLKAIDLVTQTIRSKWVFLIVLNLVLLLIGALMDIYSAIVVVVPLIVPLGNAYGIDPVHLGVIFLANLELGYLTPPVGMNLFFSSLRFKQPLLEVWKNVTPFIPVFALWVLLITYVPFITAGVASLLIP